MSDARKNIVFIVLALAIFVNVLDTTIVNVAIVSIQHTLHATYTHIQWIIAIYQMAYASFLILSGKLGDHFGRKPLFLIGMFIFALSSFLCGFAGSAEQLIFYRALQGIGGSLLYPQIIPMIELLFKSDEYKRRKSFSMIGSVVGLGIISGPLIGGFLIKLNAFDVGWRSIFYVNIPICLIILILGYIFMTNEIVNENSFEKGHTTAAFNCLLAIFTLLYPLIEGRDEGWPLWIYLMFILSLALFILFYIREVYTYKKGRIPFIAFSQMFNKKYIYFLILAAFFFMSISGVIFLTSLTLQAGYSYSAWKVGLSMVPFAIGVLISSIIGPRLAMLLGKYNIMVGGCLLIIGVFLLRMTFSHHLTHYINLIDLYIPLIVYGAGMGLCISTISGTSVKLVDVKYVGAASGIYGTIQQVGFAVGVCVVSIFYFNYLSDHGVKNVERGFSSSQHISYNVINTLSTCISDNYFKSNHSSHKVNCNDKIKPELMMEQEMTKKQIAHDVAQAPQAQQQELKQKYENEAIQHQEHMSKEIKSSIKKGIIYNFSKSYTYSLMVNIIALIFMSLLSLSLPNMKLTKDNKEVHIG